MTTRRNVLAAASGAAVAAAVVPGRAAAGGHQPSSWVGTWAAVPTAVPPSNITVLQDQTVRMVLHPSIGGDQLRVRLSNEFGEQPLAIAEAHIAHRAGTGASTDTVPGTDRRLTFGGRSSVVLPAGTPLISDAVRLRVSADTELVVSLYVQQRTPVTTLAAFAFQDTVIAAGNVTAARHVTATTTLQQWFFLSGVSVAAAGDA